MNPLVFIIIPVYNRSKEFERALFSVFAQDYSKIEIIVVDDGSEVDIESVVNKHRENCPFPLYYFWQENQGPGGARQKGLEKSTGKYIQYLDADEILLPQKISNQVDVLESHPEAVVCISGDPKYHHRNDLLELALNENPWET